DRLSLLDALLPVYAEALSRLGAAGATWVQLDEPCLALDRTPAERAAFGRAYRFLADRVSKVKLLVATYFAGLDDNVPTALELPVAGLHVDATRAPGQLDAFLKAWPAGGGREGKVLSLGVRRQSRRIHDPAVRQRVRGATERDMRRASPYPERRKKQLRLPLFPTTTIGSFPQTAEVRAARKKLHDGTLPASDYEAFIAD